MPKIDLAKLAAALERQFSDPSVPPRWDDFSEDEWKAIARALRQAPGLLAALKRMTDTFRPFTMRPIGAPGSAARAEQDEQKAAHMDAVRAIAAAERGEAMPFDPPSPAHPDVIGLRADGRKAGLAEAMAVVGNMRQSEAGMIDAKHSGQRGQDRSDALYDAYHAIRVAAERGEQ